MAFTDAEETMRRQVCANAEWLGALVAKVIDSPMTRADAISAFVCALAASTGFDHEATQEIVYRGLVLAEERGGGG